MRDSVKLIQPGPIPFLSLNEMSRQVTGTDLVQLIDIGVTPPTYALSGDGVHLGICDSGVDQNHEDFGTGTAGESRVIEPLSFIPVLAATFGAPELPVSPNPLIPFHTQNA